MSLTFAQLQQANLDRAKHWRPGLQGQVSLEFAVIELGGEVGELLNKVKKLLRHQYGLVGGDSDLQPVKDELGDVVICCSLLANKLGWDLAEIVAHKFNETSDKHGFPVKLPEA